MNKKPTKKSVDPASLTPEYIAEQRRLRNLRKEQKRAEQAANGIAQPEADLTDFIKRPLRAIPGQEVGNGFPVKIMTYNVLAQALIRRKLFPTSGNALKWNVRSEVLVAEFKHYDADVLCLQEVDVVQYNSFWKSEFAKMGYDSRYYSDATKNHGVAIVYKHAKFTCMNQSFVKYDTEQTGNIQPRTVTQNVGLLVCLHFTPEVLQQHPHLRRGIVIGTTHLFWHPFGTFERTRQTYLVLEKFREFHHTLTVLDPSASFYNFFGGDFNSQPFDAPYLSITAKPVAYTGRAEVVLGCSLSFQYSKNRLKEDAADEEGGNVEKFGKDQPRDPVPEHFVLTDEQRRLVRQMADLHNSQGNRAISLYSVGYKHVHEENAGVDNDRCEPVFSNWAHAWRGLLDYIFVIGEADGDYSERVDSLQEVEQKQGVRLVSLLRLPLPAEMGAEPSGQPRLGQYPSDHLCLMAEVALV